MTEQMLPLTSVFTGIFSEGYDFPGSIQDFTLEYDHKKQTGRLTVRFLLGGNQHDLHDRVTESMRSCGMTFIGRNAYGNALEWSALIPAPANANDIIGDTRIKNLIHTFLELLGVSGLPPSFKLKVMRESEVYVPTNPEGDDMHWIPEGQWIRECIATCFN